MRSLTVFIPGLLRPSEIIHADDLPDLPALNWMISRANISISEPSSPVYTLCQLFGIEEQLDKDFPIAAISRLNDDNQFPEGHWLRADPVHAIADRDSLILVDQNRFNLSQHDALALASEINILLEPHDLKLEVPVPYRWYMKIPEAFNLKTMPIDNVIGKNILPFMPSGENANQFIQIMNEIQMTLHNSELNKKREQEKMLPINSLWFWGCGSLPEIIQREWSLISSDEHIAKGLATITATPFKQLPDSYEQLGIDKNNFNGLLVINELEQFVHYNDIDDWIDHLITCEKNWFSPLFTALKNNEINQLQIKTESILLTLNKFSLYKFWKKKRFLNLLFN